MKINPRIYEYADEAKLIETQELENHNLEIYKLNDYEDLLAEFTNKGKFAVWSSVDGTNYRLYVEEGYYNKLKPLYGKKINNIWLAFWDKCDRVANKFRNITLPSTIVILAAILLITMYVPNPISTILVIVLSVIFFAGILVFRKLTNKKFTEANKESVDEIKKYLGAKEFERLLQDQRSYIDEYFKYEDIEENEVEENEVKEIEENKEETVENKED